MKHKNSKGFLSRTANKRFLSRIPPINSDNTCAGLIRSPDLERRAPSRGALSAPSQAPVYVCIYIYIYIYVCMHIYIYICIMMIVIIYYDYGLGVCIYIYIYIHTCAYIHIYIYIEREI